MATLVSTGQITLVDNNDARPITAYLTANPGPQQVYTKDESSIAWLPDWTTANANVGMRIAARVFVGSTNAAQEVTGLLLNRRFSFDLTTGITGSAAAISGNAAMNTNFNTGTYTVLHDATQSVFTIKANLKDTIPQLVVYFEGDYVDPITGLVSKVVAQMTLGLVKTGTNAVYIVTRGSNSIEQATGGTKNCIALSADLMRAAGVDTSGVTYQWFKGAAQIVNSAPYNTQFGLKTVASPTIPSGNTPDIGVGLPAASAWAASNTLVIHESGVDDMAVFRVIAKDTDGIQYQAYFTVYDVSDPYEVRVLSTAGDKFQNGVGSTNLTPEVYYGPSKITDLTGWTFDWILRDRNGNLAGFIDTTRTAIADGRNITANTTTTFTYDGAAITFAAGDLIKRVRPDGIASFYEIASGSANVATIKTTGFTIAGIDFTAYPQPTASQFLNGKLFVCTAAGKRSTSGATAITVTGQEIDAKGMIQVSANRP